MAGGGTGICGRAGAGVQLGVGACVPVGDGVGVFGGCGRGRHGVGVCEERGKEVEQSWEENVRVTGCVSEGGDVKGTSYSGVGFRRGEGVKFFGGSR